MRISHLPRVVLDSLGLQVGEASAHLKKVQAVYCDRLTQERICPTKCHRCISRLERMADEMPPDGEIGLWHRIVQDHTLDIVERYHHKERPAPVKKAKPEPQSATGAARELLKQLEARR